MGGSGKPGCPVHLIMQLSGHHMCCPSLARYWAVQAGLLTPLTFCPASLKSLVCFYFRCVLSSQWKAVTVNLRILHCQL